MRKLHFVFITAALCIAAACTGRTGGNAAGNSGMASEAAGDRGRATLQIGGGNASVEYGRPALKGRDVEKMIQPGQEWRMGSNAPTTLTTDVDLKFGDTVVPRGKYVLKAKAVEPERWNLLIQSEGGATVADVPMLFGREADSTELMTINLDKQGDGGRLVLRWGIVSLATDFQKA